LTIRAFVLLALSRVIHQDEKCDPVYQLAFQQLVDQAETMTCILTQNVTLSKLSGRVMTIKNEEAINNPDHS
jgi:hypothetical protein